MTDISLLSRQYGVILKPLFTEKTTRLHERNKQIAFKVAVDSNKEDIKRAVEVLFSVKVETVRTTTMKPRTHRFKGVAGTKKSFKKAYVTLCAGYDIDFSETTFTSKDAS